jgi:hypothetical protein
MTVSTSFGSPGENSICSTRPATPTSPSRPTYGVDLWCSGTNGDP